MKIVTVRCRLIRNQLINPSPSTFYYLFTLLFLLALVWLASSSWMLAFFNSSWRYIFIVVHGKSYEQVFPYCQRLVYWKCSGSKINSFLFAAGPTFHHVTQHVVNPDCWMIKTKVDFPSSIEVSLLWNFLNCEIWIYYLSYVYIALVWNPSDPIAKFISASCLTKINGSHCNTHNHHILDLASEEDFLNPSKFNTLPILR